MKLQKFKERDKKRAGIILFTIACILLVSGVILYRTFAIFEVKTNQNVIKGTVQDPGNIYFAFYVDNEIQKDMPQKNGEYIFDEDNSYCGVTGRDEHDDSIKLEFDKDRWSITVLGLKTSRTKCNLKFVSGAYILDKPIKAVTSGDGLYKVTHGDEVSDTLNDTGFKQTEWRYGGNNPNNYVNFNGEKWRMIGLVNVMTDDNHTVEQRIKIVKDTPLEEPMAWDSSNLNDWTNASLMKELNENYYNNTLSDSAKGMIDEEIIWNIGGWGDSHITTSEIYNIERGLTTSNSVTWQKKEDTSTVTSVGLMYPSDYSYATSGGALGRKKCFEETLDNWNGVNDTKYQTECAGNDWLKPTNAGLWTITPYTQNSSVVFIIDFGGFLDGMVVTNESLAVLPVVYLKSNVRILNDNQDGSKDKPYNLQQIF